MYAIFESGGKQHRAEPGQRLSLEKLEAPVGERVTFDRVLLLRDPDSGACRVGSPYLEGAQVSASVVAHFRDRKIIVFKRKRRKGYRKKQGHRQYRTQVRVEAILPAGAEAAATPAESVESAPPETAAPEGSTEESAEASAPSEAAAAEPDAPVAGAGGAEENAAEPPAATGPDAAEEPGASSGEKPGPTD